MTNTIIGSYWNQFLNSLSPTAERPHGYFEAFYFGTTREGAAGIAALVMEGIKTATGSPKWVYDAENKPLPKVGDLSIVTDGDGYPLCIIRTTEVQIVPFDEVGEQFAYDGGEGDRTLSYWRSIYWAYIVSECSRLGREAVPSAPLVCERFQVVFKDPPDATLHSTL